MLSEQLANAFTCAHAFHRDQRRKGSDRPYIRHLMAVASLVLDADGDEDAAIAGLLHDASTTRADPGRRTKSKGNSGARYLEPCASVPTGLVTVRNLPGDPAS